MKINTCTNKHFLRKIKVFIRIRQSHKKSQFSENKHVSNKMFTFSSSAQLFEKISISHEIQFFSQNWHFCTKINVEKNTCHFTPKFARHDFITVLKNSPIWPKTNTFCIKWHFLPKGNNATKNWHFSKTENTSLRKLTMSTRIYNFWKEWPFARKMKISFNIGVSARYPLIPVKHR